MAWSSVLQSAVLTLDANYEFLKIAADTDALVLTMTPGLSGVLTLRTDVVGTPTDKVEIQVVAGPRISSGNTYDSVTDASNLELDSAAETWFTADNDANGLHLIQLDGGEQGEGRLIIDSASADDGVVLSHALSGAPSAGEQYALYAFGIVHELAIDAATAAEDEPNTAHIPVNWQDGQYIAVKVRSSGATDAHRVRATYETDGGSI